MKFYKYCIWSKYTKENLEKSEVYFNIAENFNDPFELNPVYKLNCSRHLILDYFKNSLKKKNPSASKSVLKKHSRDLTNYLLSNFNNSNGIRIMNEYTKNNKTFYGILCLTTKKDNILMWSHYADFHKGICLEFDLNIDNETIIYDDFLVLDNIDFTIKTISKSLSNKVIYSNIRPQYNIFASNHDDKKETTLSLLTKSMDWQYEDEYRLLLFPSNNEIKPVFPKKIQYTQKKLTGIYVGQRMVKGNFEELIGLVKNLNFKPDIYTTHLDERNFKLYFVKYDI